MTKIHTLQMLILCPVMSLYLAVDYRRHFLSRRTASRFLPVSHRSHPFMEKLYIIHISLLLKLVFIYILTSILSIIY